jgi:hypothetical protein
MKTASVCKTEAVLYSFSHDAQHAVWIIPATGIFPEAAGKRIRVEPASRFPTGVERRANVRMSISKEPMIV